MSYKIHPLWKLERLVSPSKTSQFQPQENVCVLSHHIPKTAGSSLRTAFEKALGTKYVFGIYENTGAREMSQGNQLWIPSKAKVVHGHFRPHEIHNIMFPNAFRAVWVRDPLERIWSLIGHLLALKDKHPHYLLLKKHVPCKDMENQEKIVQVLVQENKIGAFTQTYTRFFSAIPITEFSFVGSKHNYENGLERLANMIGVELCSLQVNRRNSQAHEIPMSIKRLESYLQNEYEIVSNYL